MHWENEFDNDEPTFEPIDDYNDTSNCATEFVDDTPLDEAACSSSNVSKPAKKRGRKNFMTSRLASALDNAKVSDGMAVHILIAAAEALGHRVEELVINRSSIHRLRQENRSQESKKISTGFIDNVIYS